MKKKKLTEKQKIRKHNQEVRDYQMATQGFLGYVYPITKRKYIRKKMKYITAKQLAEELLKNPDDIICTVTDNFEQGHALKPRTGLYLSRFKGNVKQEQFRDAFDNERYSSDVVDRDEEGKQNFVKI